MFRKIPERLHLFLGIEILVGLLGFLAVVFVGKPGALVFVLFAVFPFLKKRTMDERESHLLYKTAAIAFLGFYVTMVMVYRLMPGFDLPFLMGFAAFFWHGLIGTVVFVKE
jgi:hypothetical protein